MTNWKRLYPSKYFRAVDIGEGETLTVEVERIAVADGVALAMGQQYPVTIERLRAWLDTLDGKGISLAPISAIVNMQADR